ncbi:hypothetical protein BT96DRAFT_997492 [Gymnopus androsaceus JB14]|uniref:Uncharacterized protein n=1 Tax=Gymnopus androsaceus JB14 TaxID=1447944 RepID=A0A6A4HBC0_9AGAR|nr:hypothetical protein BT96DRAFT_997492 [Gymnopus androsaceus JB14]
MSGRKSHDLFNELLWPLTSTPSSLNSYKPSSKRLTKTAVRELSKQLARPLTFLIHHQIPGITLCVFVLITDNWPCDQRVLYQCYVALALWMWSYILIININTCAFYVPHNAGAYHPATAKTLSTHSSTLPLCIA